MESGPDGKAAGLLVVFVKPRFSQEANGFNSRTLRQRKLLLNGRQLVLKTSAS